MQEPRNASLVPAWPLGSGGSACWCQAKSESWQPVMCGLNATRAEALEMCKDEDEYWIPCCSIGSEVVSNQMPEMPDCSFSVSLQSANLEAAVSSVGNQLISFKGSQMVRSSIESFISAHSHGCRLRS